MSASLEQRLEEARARDLGDPLADCRARFMLPRGADGETLLYFCGHSLGLAPRAVRAALEVELEDWEQLGVLGHEAARTPWIGYAEQLQRPLAALAGARAGEIVAMSSLSVNLHLLLASFYRPRGSRRAILIERGAFPSDRHVVASQLRWHEFDVAHELIELDARAGEHTLRAEDLEAQIAQHAGRLALVLWPGVQYLTGQCFELGRVARAAHAAGAVVGFDLAHAIGNVPLALHADEADFAVWCSYKYLNGGPGAIGGAFIHERHLQRPDLPRISGWWGHDAATRFLMSPQFQAAPGAARFALSNPPIFSAAPLRASLPLFLEAGLEALRTKSIALTGYLAALLQELAPDELELITPADPAQRGCQLSVRLRVGAERGRQVFQALQARGVIVDWREPDVLRLAPTPLYNRFEDALRAAWQLAQLLQRRS